MLHVFVSTVIDFPGRFVVINSSNIRKLINYYSSEHYCKAIINYSSPRCLEVKLSKSMKKRVYFFYDEPLDSVFCGIETFLHNDFDDIWYGIDEIKVGEDLLCYLDILHFDS